MHRTMNIKYLGSSYEPSSGWPWAY